VPTCFAHKPTLSGDLVTLRPVRAEDVDVLFQIIEGDEEVARLTGSIHSPDDRGPGWSLEAVRQIYARGATAEDRLVLAVVDRTTKRVVGEVVLKDLDEGNRSCGYRTLIGAEGRGRGLGTEATRLAVDHALRTCRLHRVELEVYDFNPRARHVYEKVGFVHEGTGREALRYDGEWIDVHYMAILETDLDRP